MISENLTCSKISVIEALASGFSPFLPSPFRPARIGLIGFTLSVLISTLSEVSKEESISVLLEFLQTRVNFGFLRSSEELAFAQGRT